MNLPQFQLLPTSCLLIHLCLCLLTARSNLPPLIVTVCCLTSDLSFDDCIKCSSRDLFWFVWLICSFLISWILPRRPSKRPNPSGVPSWPAGVRVAMAWPPFVHLKGISACCSTLPTPHLHLLNSDRACSRSKVSFRRARPIPAPAARPPGFSILSVHAPTCFPPVKHRVCVA